MKQVEAAPDVVGYSLGTHLRLNSRIRWWVIVQPRS